jgi:hypothetical protein
LIGNVTGNVTGRADSATGALRAASCTGNAATATTATTATSAATATSATTAGTVTTAAQPNITSVGTLTSLTSSGNISADSIISTKKVNSAGLNSSGGVSATTGSFSSTVGVDSLRSTKGISASLTTSNRVLADTLDVKTTSGTPKIQIRTGVWTQGTKQYVLSEGAIAVGDSALSGYYSGVNVRSSLNTPIRWSKMNLSETGITATDTTSSSRAEIGAMTWDTAFIYVRVPGGWKRAALARW